MQKTIAFLLVTGCLILGTGCELFNTEDEDIPTIDYSAIQDIRFSEHVLPLVQKKFALLLGQETGLRLDSWESLIAGSDFGEVLIPFDAENSLLLELATRLDPPHPSQATADSLTRAEIDFMARWINEGARNDAGQVPYADADQRLYVCNQDEGSISVIDTEANVVIRTVKLADFGFTGTPKPHHIDVEPDGLFWYVSLIGANTVLKFNRDDELVGQAGPFETPGMVAVHPTEDILYAGRSLSAVDPPRSIGVIRRSDMNLELVEVFFQKPHALRVSPDGAYLYTASLVTNQMASVNTATRDVSLAGFTGIPQAYLHLAISPDSRTMYMTGQVAGQLSIVDLSDPTDLALVATLDVNAGPWHPTLSPDGSRLYFGNKQANTVTVVDTQARAVVDVIGGNGLAEPHGSALSPDGRFLYISNNNQQGVYTPRYNLGDNDRDGTVVVIDTVTNEIVKVLEIGAFPTGMGARQ
ncbi:MAG: beta-propeller fold lactonase family protein [Rhodothermales bacterium]